MGRQTYIRSNEFPYHITARAHNKERYPGDLGDVWKIMLENLWLTHYLYKLEIHAFVLMPNHFHLIASTPEANLSECMQYFMKQTAVGVNSLNNTINQLHGNRYFRCLIASSHYYFHAYKYAYRNPVKALLCQRAEEYRFSTLGMRLGLTKTYDLPFCADDLLMDDIDGTLNWLNEPPSEPQWLEVRRAMRREQFTLYADKATRRSSKLETSRL